MSNAVLPTLPGLTFPVVKTPTWSTKVQTATSGKETRVGFWSYPIWKYSIGFDVLRSSAVAELQTLAGFFNARNGSFDSFLFNDPDDNAVVAQPFGIGDGATRAFQLYRQFGGYAEPVQAVNGVPIVMLNGASANLLRNSSFEYQAGGNRPSGWTCYNGGGIPTTFTTPAANSGSDAFGVKAGAATASTFGLLGNNVLIDSGIVGGVRTGWFPNSTYTLSFVAKKIGGAGWGAMLLGWNTFPASVIQVSNPALTTSYQRYIFTINWGASVEALGAMFISVAGTTALNDEIDIDDIYVVPGGPITYAFLDQSYTISPTGLVTFDVPPAPGAALSWSGNYYWRCRFLDDHIDLSKFMTQLWELKTLNFQSVK